MSKFSFVSTGLSSGLGGVAKGYIEKNQPNLHHIMLCRSPDKVAKSKNLTVVQCDLLSIKSMEAAMKKVKKLLDEGQVPPLRYVVSNAGAAFLSRDVKSEDGYEATFQINTIAPYIIIDELLPYLRKVPNARVFVTGSNVHFGDKKHTHGLVPPPYWDDNDITDLMLPNGIAVDPNPKSLNAGSRAYTISKLALMYLIYRFARYDKDIKFIVYDPGFVPGTGLSREGNMAIKVFLVFANVIFRMLGWTTSMEASGKKLSEYAFDEKLYKQANNAAYCDLGKVVKSSDDSYIEKRQDQLWDTLRQCHKPVSS